MSNIIYVRTKNNQPLPANVAGETLQLPRRGAPIGAIAYSLEGNTLHVGFSLQNSKDNWDRRRARELASSRLTTKRTTRQAGVDANGQPIFVVIEEPSYFALEATLPTDGPFRPYDAVHCIYDALVNGKIKAPTRLQRALKNMISDNERRVRVLAEIHGRTAPEPAPSSQAV
jgi:hypothetical protein